MFGCNWAKERERKSERERKEKRKYFPSVCLDIGMKGKEKRKDENYSICLVGKGKIKKKYLLLLVPYWSISE